MAFSFFRNSFDLKKRIEFLEGKKIKEYTEVDDSLLLLFCPKIPYDPVVTSFRCMFASFLWLLLLSRSFNKNYASTRISNEY